MINLLIFCYSYVDRESVSRYAIICNRFFVIFHKLIYIKIVAILRVISLLYVTKYVCICLVESNVKQCRIFFS